MTVWQFRFSLVPELGILREHGSIPAELESMKPAQPEDPLDEEYPNYWAGQPQSPRDIEAFKALLPPMESWSSDALFFGYSHGHQVELWDDDVICKLDMRAFDPELLRNYVEVAANHGCLIALHENGQVLQPDIELILEACKKSKAMRFVGSPLDTLRETGEENRARRSKPGNPEEKEGEPESR